MERLIAITKALSDPSRARIVGALGAGELCVCQIVEVLGLAPSTVSKHLALLRHAGLLELRKEGRWAYYQLAGRRASPQVRQALQFVEQALADDPQRAADATRLARILEIDPELLCSQQRAAPAGKAGKVRSRSCSMAPAARPAARKPRPAAQR